MKRFTAIFICALMVFSCFYTVFAENYVTITVNGTALELSSPARIVDSSTMIPMRELFQKLGARVSWYNEHKIVTASKGAELMSMKIGSTTLLIQNAFSDENIIEKLPVAPMIIGEKTFVPLRAVSECFGAEVNWDNETKTAHLIITE